MRMIRVFLFLTLIVFSGIIVLHDAFATLPSNEYLYMYYKFNDFPVTIENNTKFYATGVGNTTSTGTVTLGTGLFGEASGAHKYETGSWEETNVGFPRILDVMILPFEETPKISNGTTMNFWSKGTDNTGTIFDTNPGDTLSQPGPNIRAFDITTLMQSLEGQTVRLSFTEEDNLLFFNYVIDDVSLTIDTMVIVGGELLPIDNVALVITGLSSVSVWMAPILAVVVGTGFVVLRLKRK